MLHDLLSAVKGNGGDMFVWKEDHTFQIVNDLGLLHPCEVAIIEEMMVIAAHYRRLTQFCDTYDVVQVSAVEGQRCGVYLCSLAWSVRRASHPFLSAVVEVEERLLSLPSLTLTSALSSLYPHGPTLATLDTMVCEIEDEKVWGCKILEVVHKYATNSVAQVKHVLVRMEQDVHSVLYDQLTHWLLHGLLLDPHQEFFITTTTNTNTDSKDMEPLSLDEDSVSGVGVAGEVRLRVELLPSHIPLAVARKILFVGEAIQVFKQRGVAGEWSGSEGGLWGGCGAEMEAVLRRLGEEQAFSLPRLTTAIHTITQCISQVLWEVVVEGGLVSALGDLKAVYLLGRGELYQALLPSLTPYLAMPSPPPLDNLDGLFQAAGRQVLVEDSLLEKFTLSLTPADKNSSTHQKDNLWHRLCVEYHAQWPLHRLFNTAAQEKYNAIFRFLLGVRRAQHRLQQLWMTQMRTSRYREGGGGSLQWTLRHHMSLLIDNIQYYLQVDVLESEHWHLVESVVGGGKDYQQLAHAHSAFLSSVAVRCFLNHPVLSATLTQLLSLVHKFCAIAEAGGVLGKVPVPSRTAATSTAHTDERQKTQGTQANSQQAPHSQSNKNNGEVQEKEAKFQPRSKFQPATSDDQSEKYKEIEEVGASLERVAAQLFFVLSNLRLHHGSQHTAQLIMRMDYNRYYSRNDTVRRFGVTMSQEE